MCSCRATLLTQAVPPPAVLLLHLPGNYTIMDDYHLNSQLSGCRGLLSPWCHVIREQQLVKWQMMLQYKGAKICFLFIPFSEMNPWASGSAFRLSCPKLCSIREISERFDNCSVSIFRATLVDKWRGVQIAARGWRVCEVCCLHLLFKVGLPLWGLFPQRIWSTLRHPPLHPDVRMSKREREREGWGGGHLITYNTEEESSSLSLKYLSRSHNVFPISTSHDSAGGCGGRGASEA